MRHPLIRSLSLPILPVLVLLAVTPAVAGPFGTSAHTLVVAGQAVPTGPMLGSGSCSQFAAQAAVQNFFNTGVGLPYEGYAACNLGGGIQDTSGTAHEDVARTFNGASAALSADARAAIGSLGVRASGTFSGASGGTVLAGAEGAAVWSDAVTFAGSGGAFLQLGFAIDGSMTTSPGPVVSQALTFLNYQVGTEPIETAFTANSYNDQQYARNPTGPGSNPTLLPGFTVSLGSISGAGVAFTYSIPITLGMATEITAGLYAAAYPGPIAGSADSEFFSTARLTSITLTDANGRPLGVSGTSASGTLYDAAGAHAAATDVPEPGTGVLLAAGLAAVACQRRRMRSARCGGLASSLPGEICLSGTVQRYNARVRTTPLRFRALSVRATHRIADGVRRRSRHRTYCSESAVTLNATKRFLARSPSLSSTSDTTMRATGTAGVSRPSHPDAPKISAIPTASSTGPMRTP